MAVKKWKQLLWWIVFGVRVCAMLEALWCCNAPVEMLIPGRSLLSVRDKRQARVYMLSYSGCLFWLPKLFNCTTKTGALRDSLNAHPNVVTPKKVATLNTKHRLLP